MKGSLGWLFAIAAGVTSVFTFMAGPAKAFLEPELARIIFWHLPCAFITTFLLGFGAYFSVRALICDHKKRREEASFWDRRGAASHELAAIFAVLTMVTGILFSKMQWGDWWQGDPRQTSFLLVMLIALAYPILRSATGDRDKRVSVCGAMSAATLLPNLFMIFVFPRLQNVEQKSSHPSQTIRQGLLVGEYLYIFLANFVVLTTVAIILYYLRVRIETLERKQEWKDGLDEIGGGGTALTGVVRPVGVSREPE